MNRKRSLVVYPVVAGALLPSTAVAHAQLQPAEPVHAEFDAVGGWAEGQGEWSDSAQVASALSARTLHHRGIAEEKVINGTTHKRAHGWTTWTGVMHYTTAQLEHYWPWSGVIATSGRQWGTGGTEAVTAWVPFNPNAASNGFGMAKTYYGN